MAFLASLKIVKVELPSRHTSPSYTRKTRMLTRADLDEKMGEVNEAEVEADRILVSIA